MNKTDILIFGRSDELQTTVGQINNNTQWRSVGVSAVEEAIEKFHQHSFDVVVLTNVNEGEKRKLLKVFTHQHPDIIIVQYQDADRSPLPLKIQEALDERQRENKPVVSFTDDALKNAGLNIVIQ
jgi:DNA-binding NtrC family response regulator